MKLVRLRGLVLFVCTATIVMVASRDAESQEVPRGAVVRGRLILPDMASTLSFADIDVHLNQRVDLPEPPLPESWSAMTAAQRQAWWNEFAQSENGKAFLEQRRQLVEQAKSLRVRPGADGSFAIYEVLPGTWELFGEDEIEIQSLRYRLSVAAEITVAAGVDEVQLGDVPLEVNRWLKTGEPAPPFALTTLTGETMDNHTFAGRNLLLSFFSPATENSLAFQRKVLESYDALKEHHQLELLCVVVSPQKESFEPFLFEQVGTTAHFVWIKEQESALCRECGVMGLPALYLIDPRGRISLTDEEFGEQLRQGNQSLMEIIKGKLADDTTATSIMFGAIDQRHENRIKLAVSERSFIPLNHVFGIKNVP